MLILIMQQVYCKDGIPCIIIQLDENPFYLVFILWYIITISIAHHCISIFTDGERKQQR